MLRSIGKLGFRILSESHQYQNTFNVVRHYRLTPVRRDLMEFFDDKKNWGESEVKVGRSWKVDEIRLKSNPEIHKLWFILVKEKNMLLTMEHESKEEVRLFPNPERIDKIDESMKNIETVVRERNRAYYQLETGITGERPGAEQENFLGLQEYEQFDEHPVPKEENKEFLEKKLAEYVTPTRDKEWFLQRWRTRQKLREKRTLRGKRFEVASLLKQFPKMDLEALKEKYPDVDVDKYVQAIWKDKDYSNYMPFRSHKSNKFVKGYKLKGVNYDDSPN